MNEELIISKLENMERQIDNLIEVNKEMYQTLRHIKNPKTQYIVKTDPTIIKIIHAGLEEDKSIKKIYESYKEVFKDEARHMSYFYRQWNKHRETCISLKCRTYQRPYYSNLTMSEKRK